MAPADQLQLDIYGELMDSLYLADTQGMRIGLRGLDTPDQSAQLAVRALEPARRGHLGDAWRPAALRLRRLMSWVAMDRAIRIANKHGLPADLPRLTATRDAIYQQIMEKGWNAKRSAFVQHYNTDVLDASLLLMPLVGFVSPQDPHVALDAACDGPGTGLGQPGLPLQSERLARRPARP